MRESLDERGVASPGLSFLAGALAGGLATLVTHPPDVMRTRLQLQRASASALRANGGVPPPVRLLRFWLASAVLALTRTRTVPQPGMLPAVRLREIVRQEGVKALWSGITPRIARRTLQQAMTWSLFEFIYQGRIV